MPAWLQNRRNQLAVAGAILVIVVVVALFLLTRSSPPAPFTAPPGTQPSVAPSPSPSSTGGVHFRLVFSGRDPFEQIFAPAVTATPSPGATPSATPSGTTSPSVAPPTTPPPTSPGGGSSASVGGHSVVLIDIFSSGTKVTVQVDGKLYTVTKGQTFDKHFEFTGVTDGCANFLYGDQAFTLCPTANK